MVCSGVSGGCLVGKWSGSFEKSNVDADEHYEADDDSWLHAVWVAFINKTGKEQKKKTTKTKKERYSFFFFCFLKKCVLFNIQASNAGKQKTDSV